MVICILPHGAMAEGASIPFVLSFRNGDGTRSDASFSELCDIDFFGCVGKAYLTTLPEGAIVETCSWDSTLLETWGAQWASKRDDYNPDGGNLYKETENYLVDEEFVNACELTDWCFSDSDKAKIPTTNVAGFMTVPSNWDDMTAILVIVQIAREASIDPIANPTITVGSSSGKPGDTVTIPVTMENSPEFAGLEATLTYNDSALALMALENGSLQNPTLNPNTGRIVGAAADNYTLNGTICTVTFKINDSAGYGEYEIGLDVDDFYDADENPFSVDVVPGKITVSAAGTGDLTDGYNVFMDTDKTVNVNETVNVAVGIAGQGEGFDKYTNYTMKFSYNERMLIFKGITGLNTGSEEGNDKVSASAENGVITVRKYGGEQVSSDTGSAFTLQFTAVTAGTTKVTCTAAGIGNKGTAVEDDELPANILEADTDITINAVAPAEYDVELSNGSYDTVITGSNKATAGQDYTFTVDDPYYDYTFTATVNGETVPVTGPDNNGNYTIAGEDVTGDISIVLTERTGKTYNVTVKDGEGTTLQDPSEVDVMLPQGVPTHGTDYVFSVAEVAGFNHAVAVTVGGEAVSPSVANGNYTIAGAAITGDVVITVTKTAIVTDVTVEFTGTGAAKVVGGTPQTAPLGQAFTFTVGNIDTAHYDYTVTVARGNAAIPVTAGENGAYTIAAEYITAGDVITVTVDETRNLHLQVQGTEYVKFDGSTGVLIRATAALLPGEVLVLDNWYGELTDDVKPMYLTTANAYKDGFDDSPDGVWLTLWTLQPGSSIRTILSTINHSTGGWLLKVKAGNFEDVTLNYDYNVNQSQGGVDTNDAQLVWNMYNGLYVRNSIDTKKFLLADTNQDMVINVLDSGAIVNYIING